MGGAGEILYENTLRVNSLHDWRTKRDLNVADRAREISSALGKGLRHGTSSNRQQNCRTDVVSLDYEYAIWPLKWAKGGNRKPLLDASQTH